MELAALGVYGVIAFMVATRTREIGVRVALGASRARVLRDVLGDALGLVVPGIALGLLLAVLWVRLADPAWYPLGGVEPLVYSMAAATVFAVAVLAGIPSARRAAECPMDAMRAESGSQVRVRVGAVLVWRLAGGIRPLGRCTTCEAAECAGLVLELIEHRVEARDRQQLVDSPWHVQQLQPAALPRGTGVGTDNLASEP